MITQSPREAKVHGEFFLGGREENPEKNPMSASSLEGLLLEVTKPPPGSRQNASKAASGTQSAIRPTKEDIN